MAKPALPCLPPSGTGWGAGHPGLPAVHEVSSTRRAGERGGETTSSTCSSRVTCS